MKESLLLFNGGDGIEGSTNGGADPMRRKLLAVGIAAAVSACISACGGGLAFVRDGTERSIDKIVEGIRLAESRLNELVELIEKCEKEIDYGRLSQLSRRINRNIRTYLQNPNQGALHELESDYGYYCIISEPLQRMNGYFQEAGQIYDDFNKLYLDFSSVVDDISSDEYTKRSYEKTLQNIFSLYVDNIKTSREKYERDLETVQKVDSGLLSKLLSN